MDVLITTRQGKRVAYSRGLEATQHLALCTSCTLKPTCSYHKLLVAHFGNYALRVAVYQCPDYTGVP